MGTSSSRHGDITTNEYLQRFVGSENISPNDPFWNRFLSFSYTPPVSSFKNQVLDERIQPLCKQLVINNPRSGNVGSLLHVFLSRSSELLASTQTENSMFSWQTYNALFILRCVTKYLIESIKEDDVIRQFEARPQEQDGLKQVDEHVSRMEIFLDSLLEIVVDVPVKDFTYPLHLEAINCLLILLSVQMFSQKPAARSFIYRSLMQGRYSIHAPLLVKKLLQHFINQEKAPPGLYNLSGGGSLVVTLASELWNMITWGLSRASSSSENAETAVAKQADIGAPLANQSVLLILVLANHCTSDKNLHNPYRQALFSFSNSEGNVEITPTRAASTFKIDMSQLYKTLSTAVSSDQTTLLLYLLVHRNPHVRTYILACSDIEQLVIPILKTLYHAPNSNSHHIYMSLIILLILSEDDLFNKAVHEMVLKGVSWYTERSISEISLGGLLVLVIIRTIQYNMLKMRDKYLHTNCLAALANMSSQFRNLHPYVTQRLVSLFETLAKKHIRLEEQLHRNTSDVAVNVDDDAAAVDLAQDVSVLEEVLRMILEVLNSCLSHQLAYNTNLIYTLLYKRHVFEPYQSHQAFQDVVQNIDTVITYFSHKLNQVQKHLSVTEVQETIQQGALEWNKEKLRKFPDLKFKYVEEDQPEDFFIPYVWSLVCQTSGLHWNPANNKLFVPDMLNVLT
ncbi:dymeclin isoform X1 [Schistocerca serialis cubense]|uniref:dymeclin isoform X1 n=1 Tax=Schistocerca serialis cubense TaxID=2023355 RepID=UPI00214ED7B8|nr:dymeclin isoform X1 [Schistocerca serialis cubense]